MGALWALSMLPTAWALASTIVCALVLWPVLRNFFAGQSKLPTFVRGALIGIVTLLASAFLAHFANVAFEMATDSNSGWGFILGPMYFLMYASLPQAWASLLISAVIGGVTFAFSEAVG